MSSHLASPEPVTASVAAEPLPAHRLIAEINATLPALPLPGQTEPISGPERDVPVSRESSASSVSRRLAVWTLVVTGFCILLPGVAAVLGLSNSSIETTQNRPPASFPTLELRWRGPVPVPRSSSLAAWPAGFEAWWNDRWGYRRELQQAFAASRVAGLTPQALDLPRPGAAGQQVVVGNQGWLFYGGQNALESYRAITLLTAAELAAWVDAFRARRDWLARRGIPYVVLFAPDKSTLYPGHLPRSVTQVSSTTRLDQLVAALRDVPGLLVVDPREALRQAGHVRPTYAQTDSHWNAWGALVACSQLLDQPEFAGRGFAGPFDPAGYRIESLRTKAGGDLSTLLDSPVPLADDTVRVTSPYQSRLRVAFGPRTVQQVRRVTNRGRETGSAVVLHDSFFLPMLPFFCERFHTVTTVAYADFAADLIERERPSLVVQELVERSLVTRDPASLERLPP
jgi:alginate O-acetyltransferase complex protein AlgJ